MYSAYKLNKQCDNIQPWRTLFPIWNLVNSKTHKQYGAHNRYTVNICWMNEKKNWLVRQSSEEVENILWKLLSLDWKGKFPQQCYHGYSHLTRNYIITDPTEKASSPPCWHGYSLCSLPVFHSLLHGFCLFSRSQVALVILVARKPVTVVLKSPLSDYKSRQGVWRGNEWISESSVKDSVLPS